jgi:hypothetical protein
VLWGLPPATLSAVAPRPRFAGRSAMSDRAGQLATRLAARPVSGESSETPLLPASRESRRLLRPSTGGKAAQPGQTVRTLRLPLSLQPKCPPALAPPEPAAFKVESLRQTKEVSSEEEPPVGRGVFLKKRLKEEAGKSVILF